MLEIIYSLLSTILLMFVAYIWSTSGFLNVLIKFVFSVSWVFGAVVFLNSIGIVVQR
jgi:hypothetical protein